MTDPLNPRLQRAWSSPMLRTTPLIGRALGGRPRVLALRQDEVRALTFPAAAICPQIHLVWILLLKSIVTGQRSPFHSLVS